MIRTSLTEDDLKTLLANRTRGKGTVVGGVDGTRKARTNGARMPENSDLVAGSNPAPLPYKSKLEACYAAHLDMLVKAGEIRRWWYEPTSFKLAAGKRFRPDFLIEYPSGLERGLEYVEIKSRYNKNIRDGLTHLKWCAQLYPCFVWKIVYWKGHGWDASYVEV
jgi:hypothetical protein